MIRHKRESQAELTAIMRSRFLFHTLRETCGFAARHPARSFLLRASSAEISHHLVSPVAFLSHRKLTDDANTAADNNQASAAGSHARE